MRRMSESHLLRMRIIAEIGTFAPLLMNMRINPKIFCFLHFWPYISSNFFINNIIRLNSTRAIDWCINCHVLFKKKFNFFDPQRLRYDHICKSYDGKLRHLPHLGVSTVNFHICTSKIFPSYDAMTVRWRRMTKLIF